MEEKIQRNYTENESNKINIIAITLQVEAIKKINIAIAILEIEIIQHKSFMSPFGGTNNFFALSSNPN